MYVKVDKMSVGKMSKANPIKPCKLCDVTVAPCTTIAIKDVRLLNSKNDRKRFGESVYILSIFVFDKFSTFFEIKLGKSRKNVIP